MSHLVLHSWLTHSCLHITPAAVAAAGLLQMICKKREGGLGIFFRRGFPRRGGGEIRPARVGVHATGGFVQENNSRAAKEGDGYAELAALPSRQLPCCCVQLALQPCIPTIRSDTDIHVLTLLVTVEVTVIVKLIRMLILMLTLLQTYRCANDAQYLRCSVPDQCVPLEFCAAMPHQHCSFRQAALIMTTVMTYIVQCRGQV